MARVAPPSRGAGGCWRVSWHSLAEWGPPPPAELRFLHDLIASCTPLPDSPRRPVTHAYPAESEAEGEGVAGGGCFPDFEDAESFETYIDGQWQYSEPSNAAGIALSVSFFVGLVVLALFMRS